MTDESREYDGLFDDIPGELHVNPNTYGLETFDVDLGVSDKTLNLILNIVGVILFALIVLGILTS